MDLVITQDFIDSRNKTGGIKEVVNFSKELLQRAHDMKHQFDGKPGDELFKGKLDKQKDHHCFKCGKR